jgi:hypothetical protein
MNTTIEFTVDELDLLILSLEGHIVGLESMTGDGSQESKEAEEEIKITELLVKKIKNV